MTDDQWQALALRPDERFFVRLHPTEHVVEDSAGFRATSVLFSSTKRLTLWATECYESSVDCARLLDVDWERALASEREIRDQTAPGWGIGTFSFAEASAKARLGGFPIGIVHWPELHPALGRVNDAHCALFIPAKRAYRQRLAEVVRIIDLPGREVS